MSLGVPLHDALHEKEPGPDQQGPVTAAQLKTRRPRLKAMLS